MATRRDDRAAQIAASFTSDPFFDENAAPRPVGGRTMQFAPERRGRPGELVDEGDLLEETDDYGDEHTQIHSSALEEGVLDDDDMGAGFGDEERTMIWQGNDEAPAEDWPVPSPAPIVYAARPTRGAPAVAPAAAPAPRATRRTEPAGQALHYGSPGVAEVAPRRTLSHQPTGGVIVAEPYAAPPPSRPVQRQTIAPRAAPPAPAEPAQPQPEQKGMPPLQVALVVLLAILTTAVIALALQLGRSPAAPATTAAAPTAVVALFSTPAGATVKVDGVAHSAPTPTVLTSLEVGRTYNVSLELAGYQPIATTILPESTEPVERQFALVPVTGTLVVNSNPAGATITFDGTVRGAAPQTIAGLDLSRTYTVSATLDGHTPATQAVRWAADAPPEQTIELGLAPLPAAPAEPAVVAAPAEPAATAPAAVPAAAPQQTAPATTTRTERPSSTSTSRTSESSTTTRTERPSSTSTTTARPSERPSERPAQRPSSTTSSASSSSSSSATASGGGTISIQAVPYGQVWINNRVVANETPLLNYELPVGVHQVKVYFSSLRTFSDERSIRIEPGSSRTLTFRAPPQQ